MRGFDDGDLLRRANGDDLSAFITALRPEIDDVIGALDDLQVVLDDDNRMALLEKLVERLQQPFDIMEMEPGGGLVEDKQRARFPRLGHVPCQF